MAKLKAVKRIKHDGKTVLVKYDDGHIRVDNVRLSYPHLETPQESDDGSKKFAASFIMNKETHSEVYEFIKSECEKLAREAKVKVPAGKYAVKDGDEEFPDKPEYENSYSFTAREKRRPVCRDGDKVELDADEIAETLYAGCYVSVLIRLWVQDNKYGKRVNANLKSVKFIKDGEPFGEAQIDDTEVWDDEDEWGEDDEEEL